MEKKEDKKQYEQKVSLQPDNHEAAGSVENQNTQHNIKKQALGPNTKR